MSDENTNNLDEFLGYDPEAVEALNRTIGVNSSQNRHRSKKQGSGKVIDKGVGEDALEAIREEMKK